MRETLTSNRQVAAIGTQPPAYEDSLQTVPTIPAMGDLSTGAFEQIVIARLERLEAGQGRIEAAIFGISQSQTRNQTYGRRLQQPYYQRVYSALDSGVHRLHRMISRWLNDRWLNDQICRIDCYRVLFAAKGLRFNAWMFDLVLSGPEHVELMTEALRDADLAEEEARWTLESLKRDRL